MDTILLLREKAMINETQNKLSNLSDQAEAAMDQTKETLKQSGQDWYDYLKNHPIQTLLYGSVIFYAIKGLLNSHE